LRRQILTRLSEHLPSVAFVEFLNWGADRTVKQHVHSDMHQIDCFVEGEGTYTIGDNAYSVNLFSFYVVPPDTGHSIHSSQEHPLVGLSVKFGHPDLMCRFLPPVLQIRAPLADQAVSLFRKVVSEAVLDEQEHKLIASLRLVEMLTILLDAYYDKQSIERKKSLVEDAIDFLQCHFHEPLTLDVLADEMNVSGAHLCRLFRKKVNTTPLEVLRQMRVEFAQDQLAQTGQNIRTIAGRAGFRSPQAMNHAFKTLTGMSPREYSNQVTVNNKVLSKVT